MTLDHEADEIFSAFRRRSAEGSLVVAQLGQSLDGRIATLTGESKYINGQAALEHLHRLRAHVDAVLVGVGTVVADDPLLTVRLVPGRDPVRVIVDPKGRLPHSARCLACPRARNIVVRAHDAVTALPPGVDEIRLPTEAGWLDPNAVVEALARRGLRRILVEGGAHTISGFIDAGAVDRLHVLVAPMILGSGKPGLELAPIKSLHHALKPATRVRMLADGNVLFDCDLRAEAAAPVRPVAIEAFPQAIAAE
jgi:diaminohydroxyphosphoribosylaminopyrimidine deaminase / 5-amino-6-(5-phosphoribosylamino)uracil reductase